MSNALPASDPPSDQFTLLLDADDTLWENNVYFLEVSEELVRLLEQQGIDRELTIRSLNLAEIKIIETYGYGSRSFARAIGTVYRELARDTVPAVEQRLRRQAESIFVREHLELRPGAREVVSVLSLHHRLILVTKGDRWEQERKLALSGLQSHFEWVEIVPEKDVRAYQEIIERYQLNPDHAWMIGNSPRSDINPAVAAGLRAILVPHPDTWDLELEDLRDPYGRVTIVESLADLLVRFVPNG